MVRIGCRLSGSPPRAAQLHGGPRSGWPDDARPVHGQPPYGARRWLLQFGAAAEVLAPDWLLDQVRDDLAAALARYPKSS